MDDQAVCSAVTNKSSWKAPNLTEVYETVGRLCATERTGCCKPEPVCLGTSLAPSQPLVAPSVCDLTFL